MARGTVQAAGEMAAADGRMNQKETRGKAGQDSGQEADYTKGIFQSIGFKEFHEYLLLAEGERECERGRRMFQEAVAALKTVTRRYARKQVRWVVNRFLRQPQRQVPPVYAFDTSDPSKWDDIVYKPAVHVVDSLLNGKTPTDIKPLPLEEPLSNEPTSFHCEVCDRIFIGNIQWEAHIKSKKHKRVVQQKRKEKLGLKFRSRKESEEKYTDVQIEENTCTTGSQTEDQEKGNKEVLTEP
ncbi:tRNA dimethylallyltransferase [Gryllus bimaculatus]|nr:tRNA dimethylallyltransferase [Gryllus bimaculatus]